MVDESVAPQTLKSRDLKGVADYIKSGRVKKIVVMVIRIFLYSTPFWLHLVRFVDSRLA
jgi:hypothetical protein